MQLDFHAIFDETLHKRLLKKPCSHRKWQKKEMSWGGDKEEK